MDIRQLEAFREVMRTGTMSGAGRSLGRSQPAISAIVAALEAEFGTPLFRREGGRLHPVPEAYYLLEEAEAILGRIESAAAMMRASSADHAGSLRIAAMPGPSVFLLPQVIADFTRERRDVSVTLLSRSSAVVHRLVATQRYDAGFADLGTGDDAPSSLLEIERFIFPCLCALASDDPLASREGVDPRDLSGYPMAALYRDHPTRLQTEAAFAARGARFDLRFEAQYFLPLLTYVENGLAASVVDPLTAEAYASYRGDPSGVVFRPFTPPVTLDTALIVPTHQPLSRLAQAFVATLRERLAQTAARSEPP